MRYGLLAKAILALSLAISFVGIDAAAYRDGVLYVEILLYSGNSVSLTAGNGIPATVTFSETESLIKHSIQTPVSICLENTAPLPCWSFLERTEAWTDASEGVLRETFIWEDSTLVIKRENLVFSEQAFPDKEAAQRYAALAGIPKKQIQSIPLLNATVRLRGANGTAYYMETPLRFTSSEQLYLDSSKLAYSGEFILKAVNGKLVITHFLPLEDYVAGVIPNEIGSNAPLEAMKAQAVAARTHAVSLMLGNRHKDDGYDLCNATHCQVYKGKYLQNDSVRAAVSATHNEVLTLNDRIADATYHSACGGKTDSSKNIWDGEPLPHLNGVVCDEAAAIYNLTIEADLRQWISGAEAIKGGSAWEAAALAWSKQLGRRELAQNVGLANIDHLVINRRGISGRITDMTFYGEKTVRLTSEYKIRQAFGSARSSLFYIEGGYVLADNNGVVIYPGGTVSIKGRGSGHGVGMCQVGALRRAREGENYMEILFKYYPGTELSADWMEHETH